MSNLKWSPPVVTHETARDVFELVSAYKEEGDENVAIVRGMIPDENMKPVPLLGDVVRETQARVESTGRDYLGTAYYAARVLHDILPDVLAEQRRVEAGDAQLSSNIDFPKGCNVADATYALVVAAKATNITLVGDFNGIPLIATPDTLPGEAMTAWSTAREEYQRQRGII